ncbi:MAG: DUF6677 family protein [Bryobacteraceae bacterium]
MPATTSGAVESAAPIRSPILVILAAWLVPGSGHFLLGRKGRAAIIFFAVLAAFLIGVAMRGPFFSPAVNGDILSKLIQYGGIAGDLASGLLYFIATFSGYNPPDAPGHAADYGSKFIVCAGLLNILGTVDAYEIATRQKD